MAHRRSVVLLALVSLLAAPEVASAGTVSAQDGRLDFTAGGGEANALRLAPAEGAVTVSDADSLQAGDGCVAVDAVTARCDLTGIETAVVELGDGDDSVAADELTLPATLSGGAGDDRLAGGLGADRFEGGPGADTADFTGKLDGTWLPAVRVAMPLPAGDEGDVVASDVERMEFGPGPDVVDDGPVARTVRTGAGADHVGMTGDGSLFAGPGDDRVLSVDSVPGSPETIDCGPGADTVYTWGDDRVDDNCEHAVYPNFVGEELPSWMTDRARREVTWYKMTSPLTVREVPPDRRQTLPDGRTVEITDGDAVAVTCKPACSMSARLTVTRKVARRLGLGSTRATLARIAPSRRAGKQTRSLRYTRRARAALRRVGSVPATLEVRTVDAAGKARVDLQRVRVTRSGRIRSRPPG